MLDPFTSWSRLMTAAFDVTRTGQRVQETIAASHEVVAKRTGIIQAAMGAPLTADYAELGRMVPEKVEAFSKAGATIVNEWWSMQAAFMAEAQHFGTMAMRGRPPTLPELATLASRNMAYGLHSIERAVALGVNTVAPIHAKATSNARRLKRVSAKK